MKIKDLKDQAIDLQEVNLWRWLLPLVIPDPSDYLFPDIPLGPTSLKNHPWNPAGIGGGALGIPPIQDWEDPSDPNNWDITFPWLPDDIEYPDSDGDGVHDGIDYVDDDPNIQDPVEGWHYDQTPGEEGWWWQNPGDGLWYPVVTQPPPYGPNPPIIHPDFAPEGYDGPNPLEDDELGSPEWGDNNTYYDENGSVWFWDPVRGWYLPDFELIDPQGGDNAPPMLPKGGQGSEPDIPVARTVNNPGTP